MGKEVFIDIQVSASVAALPNLEIATNKAFEAIGDAMDLYYKSSLTRPLKSGVIITGQFEQWQ